MSDVQQKKKKKYKGQLCLEETEQNESELLPELIEKLEEIAKKKKYVDIQVCPKCKSPLINRVSAMSGDMFSHMGLTPPKYECKECGWRAQIVIKATNKPTTVRDVVIIAEANEAADNEKRKRKV
jgi:RNase P subunit RPR2